ncbi:MAG: hypothetical protein JWP40_910 [Blastococcus sp.]|nr:hypothetical protein [Blastococcus sp.]
MDPGEQYLTERAAGRDEQAFAELVRRHQDQLYRVALRMTDDPGALIDLRRRIGTDLHRHTGLTSGTIDVNVIDVHPPHGT